MSIRAAVTFVLALLLGACVTPEPAREMATVKASAYNVALEPYMLVIAAGDERGVYARHGLAIDWQGEPGRVVDVSRLRKLLEGGTGMGLSSPSEILLARAEGMPLRIVAGFVGDTLVDVYVLANGPVREPRDLAGRTVGATSPAVHRRIPFLGQAYGVEVRAAPVASLDENIAALRAGRIDAVITAEARIVPLVRRGEARRLLRTADIRPRPELNNAVWASDAMIARHPERVAAFVEAVLETVALVQGDPAYGARIVAARTGMDPEDARAAVARIDWVSSGQPGGDLTRATRNYLEPLQRAGTMPASLRLEDILDTRFVGAR